MNASIGVEVGWVQVKKFCPGSGQPSLVWVRKISPKNPKFFIFFTLRLKKISSCWVKKYQGQSWVSLLFTFSILDLIVV